tara:strand:- start:34 stop:651 length:618 start_codon:yes stop_codon:yes gene_type:complete
MENDAGLGAFVQLDPLDFYTKPNSMDVKEERDYKEHVLHKAEVKLFLPRFEYTDVEQLKNQKIQDTNSIPLRDQDRSSRLADIELRCNLLKDIVTQKNIFFGQLLAFKTRDIPRPADKPFDELRDMHSRLPGDFWFYISTCIADISILGQQWFDMPVDKCTEIHEKVSGLLTFFEGKYMDWQYEKTLPNPTRATFFDRSVRNGLA